MSKVLIIDDDQNISTFMSQLLVAKGHTPVIAENGDRARDMLTAHPDVALVILDHHLDVRESGLQFLADFRQNTFTRRLPVLVCSGDSKRDAVSGFLSLEISGFIVKPFRNERFTSEVERVLRESSAKSRVLTH